MTRADWRTSAACLSVDPELFFPTADAGRAYSQQVAAAKAVCVQCPVRVECLDEALARIPYGIAGGLTPEERRCRGTQQRRSSTAALEIGSRAVASRGEVEAAGRLLLAQDVDPRTVARRCGVSERTVARWIVRQTDAVSNAERGVAAATATPGSPDHNPLAGTRITEGTRV